MQIIDGREVRDKILDKIKGDISKLDFQPIFCDVLVGDNPVSKQYVEMKARTAEKVGIRFHNASFPADITTEKLIEEIDKINKLPNICGIILQLPLPEFLDQRRVLDAIDFHLDVDCLGTIASDKFYKNENEIGFPTALACMNLLDSLDVDLIDKKIVVLGQGKLVGKPVAALLNFRNLKPEIVTRQTENKTELIKQADVIISGMGHGKFITGDMIKNNAILIDAGTSESNSGIVGDVDLESVKDVAGFVSPVPGGVGPVTVAILLNNVLQVAKKIKL